MNRFASLIVRLAAFWLLTGACFKFFDGDPNKLPGPVRGWPFGITGNFKAAIAVELAVGTLALLVPRLGWFPLAGAMALFIAILVAVVQAGEASCGCFGASGPPPLAMLGIDVVLLVLMLLSKPWRIPKTSSDGRKLVTWLPLALAGAAAPLISFREVEIAPTVVVDDVTGEVVWSPPPRDQWSRIVAFELGDWTDKTVAETELATWFDTSLWPPDFTGIIWRNSCSHCAEHLRELAAAEASGDVLRSYVMIRVPGDEDQETLVKERPTLIEQELVWEGPELAVTTPVEFTVAGGVITNVREDFQD